MLYPKLSNCPDCNTIPALIGKIDCKIAELSNNLYNNTVFILNKQVNGTLMNDLLNYRRILSYKYCNPDYASCYSVNMIASRVNLLAAGAKNCNNCGKTSSNCDEKSSTTTTTTETPCYCYTVYILTGKELDYQYISCNGNVESGRLDITLPGSPNSITFCAKFNSVSVTSVTGSTGQILTSSVICTDFMVCNPITTSTTSSSSTSTTSTTTTPPPPCYCYYIEVADGRDATALVYLACDGTSQSVGPGNAGFYCIRQVINFGTGTATPTGDLCQYVAPNWECPPTTTTTTTQP